MYRQGISGIRYSSCSKSIFSSRECMGETFRMAKGFPSFASATGPEYALNRSCCVLQTGLSAAEIMLQLILTTPLALWEPAYKDG